MMMPLRRVMIAAKILPSYRLGVATTPGHRNRASHGDRRHPEMRPKNNSSPSQVSAAADVHEGPGPV